MAVDVTAEIEIACSVERVFEFAADPDNVPHWYVNIQSVNWKTSRPVQLGSQVEFVAQFMGKTLQYTYEFVELEPNRRVVMKTASGPFPMETIYEFRSLDSGNATNMSLRNRGQPSGFSKIMSPLMSIMMRRAMKKDLLKLKGLLEDSSNHESD